MSDANKQWGERLKQARLAAGLSQKILGIEAGLDPFVASTRINRYELGIHKPDLPTVRKLAAVLKVPVAFFYADTDEIAELLLMYGKATKEERQKTLKLLATKSPIPGRNAQTGAVKVTSSELEQVTAADKGDEVREDG